MDRFRFGIFEFDTVSRELRRNGALVRLQAQPAQVLACLAARAGEVVSREDLRSAIWGSDTFVDFDRGLNFCIGQVRSALDDDSVAPRYIRTIPKQGYQFIAPVERVVSETERSQEPKGAPATSRFPRVAALICAAVVLAALALVAGHRLRAWQGSKRRPIVAVLRFDNETTDPRMTQFSDGLTDNLVEELTTASQGRYEVVGNAHPAIAAGAARLAGDFVIAARSVCGVGASAEQRSANENSGAFDPDSRPDTSLGRAHGPINPGSVER